MTSQRYDRHRTILLLKGPYGGRARVDEPAWLLHSHLDLAARPGAVPRARHHARRVLTDWGLGALGEPVELVVSELVTNAIRACPAAAANRRVRLRLASDRACVLIEVQDGSPQPPVRADATAEDENGRGLWLVEALSAAWDWYPHHASGGKVVWALMPAAGHCARRARRPRHTPR
jgi:anti-sigma regulatory factor (Ser/Thr protein kinase)